MNRHGRRFIDLRDFKHHAKSLNVKRLGLDELGATVIVGDTGVPLYEFLSEPAEYWFET